MYLGPAVSSEQMDHEHYKRHDKDHVNKGASDMKDKAERPKNDQDDSENCEHMVLVFYKPLMYEKRPRLYRGP
jgi:hypothetical protein